MTLDTNTRWVDAMQEIRFHRAAASPSRSRADCDRSSQDRARQNWRRAAVIVRHACHDHGRDDALVKPDTNESKDRRQTATKTMGLNYFLEMIDVPKHRYASNLRAYHELWTDDPNAPSNFFEWLDGSDKEHEVLQNCDRSRLDRERVRYLSREEKMRYLVSVDIEGRLCWARNGEKITTSLEFVDSYEGCILRKDSTTTQSISTERMNCFSVTEEDSRPLLARDPTDSVGRRPSTKSQLQPTKSVARTKKSRHFSLSILFNQILQLAVPPNSWIFIVDPALNLYVNIKRSGGFQHSSFLSGSCAVAAGVIKVKDGQLLRLTPLSGHYRPTTKEFRAFEKRLEVECGVDMSHTKTSWALLVLGGLEGYMCMKRGTRKAVRSVTLRCRSRNEAASRCIPSTYSPQ